MHIVLGGTGHVGSATARALLERDEAVTIVTRDAAKGEALAQQGAEVAVADIHDIDALRTVLKRGKRLFLLNPLADPTSDTDAEEHRSITALLKALEGSGLEKIVALSTYGAQPGERIGDLGTLYALEQGLAAQSIPFSVLRAAYYMTNWDGLLDIVKTSGTLPTMLPTKLSLAMVAPDDIGKVASELLTAPLERAGLYYVEGPAHYSANDVAAAFAHALGRPVEVEVTPREAWVETFVGMGFSAAAAESYANMTALSVDGAVELPDAPLRGETALQAYVDARVASAAQSSFVLNAAYLLQAGPSAWVN